MNDQQFQEQYKRLIQVHPNYFSSQEKLDTIWRFVSDMPIEWFRSLVDRIIMSNRADKIDIGESVAAERRHNKSKKFADEVSEATKNWSRVSEIGLDKILEKYGTSNLVDAVTKSQKGNL